MKKHEDYDVYGGLRDASNELKPITKERFCKICEKKLSVYNTNKYCFAHLGQGTLMDIKKKEARGSK